jgi:hypothetical protein
VCGAELDVAATLRRTCPNYRGTSSSTGGIAELHHIAGECTLGGRLRGPTRRAPRDWRRGPDRLVRRLRRDRCPRRSSRGCRRPGGTTGPRPHRARRHRPRRARAGQHPQVHRDPVPFAGRVGGAGKGDRAGGGSVRRVCAGPAVDRGRRAAGGRARQCCCRSPRRSSTRPCGCWWPRRSSSPISPCPTWPRCTRAARADRAGVDLRRVLAGFLRTAPRRGRGRSATAKGS